MLQTKSILSRPEAADGLRISVMSRHTLNDGRTTDERITGATHGLHWPQLGPDASLIGDYYRRGLAWEDFERRYLERLRTDVDARRMLVALLTLLRRGKDVTVLCIELTPHRCHRRLLAEECVRNLPSLMAHIL